MIEISERKKKDPKTGYFVKVPEGRRNRVYLNDSELSFIKLWRKSRKLGQKYASENVTQLIEEIREELTWDYVSFLTGRDLTEELEKFFTRCSVIMGGVFGSYEEEEKLELKSSSETKRVVKYLSCYAHEEEEKVIWVKEKIKPEYRV